MSTARLKNSTDALAASVRFPNHAPQWAVLTHIGLFWQESSNLTFTTCYSREQLCPSPKMMEIFFPETASSLLPRTSVWAPRRKGTPSRRQVIGLPFFKILFTSWPSAKHSQLLYNALLCNQNLRMMNEDLTCQEYANLNFNLRRVCVPSNYWIFSLWWHFYKCKM